MLYKTQDAVHDYARALCLFSLFSLSHSSLALVADSRTLSHCLVAASSLSFSRSLALALALALALSRSLSLSLALSLCLSLSRSLFLVGEEGT
jgi:hypothetical protein